MPTDPQDDVPCRGCETEGPPTRLGHDGLCPDCQIPALRLMSDLAALGIFATRNEDGSVRVADVLTVDVETDGAWCISGSDHDADGWTAPEAVAAIANRDAHAHLVAEVKRLREEMGKPVAGAWVNDFRPSERGHVMAAIKGYLGGWAAYHANGGPAFATGPETGDAGRHAADLALLAAGYRLVGGVHLLPDEVRS